MTAPAVTAQNCGCAEDQNCPFSFTPNSTTTVCYDVEDAFNNDLANPDQGVCGVSVFFESDEIGSFDLTLTAPNGTAVQFTGTTGNCNNWTLISTWDILFVPCGELCTPDTINGCELPCTFDNCPSDCLWPNAMMTGSYLPYNGCLEDFNNGPVNGEWCLTIDNSATFQGGTIFDFEVLLCDQSGFECCDADAGNLAFEPDVDACEGDSALQLTPEPMYGAVVPDPSEYGYTYAVFSNGSLIALDTTTDFRTYTLGSYQLCGISYLLEDSLDLPAIGTSLSAADIYDNLIGPTPDFCGDIDTNCIIINIFEPPPVASLTDSICFGDTLFIGNNPYDESGFFIDTIQSVGGCDSIVHLDLTVLAADTTEIITSVCNDEEYIVGMDTFDVSGMYETLLQNQFGCDSLVMLDLTVLMPFETNLTETICLGDTSWIGSTPYFETGIFSDTLLTVLNGCDSIVNLDLTVVEVNLSIDLPDTLTCFTTAVTLTGNALTSLGTLTYQWETDDGNITSNANAASVQVNEPGMYYLTVTAANCAVVDSVFVEESADDPTAIALAISPELLTCVVDSVQLDASTSSGGPNLTYLWTGNVSTPNSSTPFITEPGIYEVLVTNTDNGCTDTDAIEIFQNINVPNADPGQPDTLSCSVTSLFLDGSGSTPAGNISFEWTTILDGNFISPTNIPNPEVNASGIYQLTVTHLTSGCLDSALVGISNDQNSPLAVIDISNPSILSCVVDTVFLDGSNSENISDVTFEWIGNIADGQGTEIATVTEAGEFSLALFNTVTGCSDTTTVVVDSNYTTPIADAGVGPDAITCQDPDENIGGINTTIGANILHQWTSSPEGELQLPATSPFAVAIAPGTYYLTVTNTISGCTAVDSVFVDDAIEPLEAIVIPDMGELTCEEPTFVLDGSASIYPPNVNIDWYNSAGDNISNQLSFEINHPDSFLLVLEFGVCIDSALVEVTGIPSLPFADAGADVFVDCFSGQAVLDGSNSDVGSNYTYQWIPINGEIILGASGLSPTVEGIGEYEIEVLDTNTGCSTFDTVQVLLDSIACMPDVDAGADGTVFCSPVLINLQGSGSVGPNISYEWTMLPDSILTDQSLNPLVSEGTYVLAVTNEAVGLTAFDTVVVVPDTVAPIADIGPFLLALTCPELESCYSLDVAGTSQGADFSYEWASLSGNFCTPTDILNVEVTGAGTYELVVTDNSNMCTAMDNVILQLADTLVDVEIVLDDVQMACGATDTVISANVLPNSSNLDFSWTSSGDILNGQNTPTVTVNAINQEDVFYLTVTNNINQCTDVDSISVFAPVNCEPLCAASVTGVIDCNNSSVQLSAFGSSMDTSITYLWTALTGNLCGGETSDTACADAAGIYRLTVSRTYPNGAVFTAACDVSVEDNSQPPLANAGLNDDLNCIDETLELDGTGSDAGPNIIYQWSTNAGSILDGSTTLTPEVGEQGTYELTVTDTLTGCSATDDVLIGEDLAQPNAEAGADLSITCASNSVLLDGETSITNAVFLWTTNNGSICSNPNQEDINACAPGLYYFTVTNSVNGCSATDSVLVDADEGFPVVNVGGTLEYTCIDTVFTIPSNITEPGSGVLDFSWDTADGCFSSDTNIMQPTVNCPGTYVLTVTDLVNNCSSEAIVIVEDNTAPPVADAGMTNEINCSQLTLQLDGSNSSPAGQLDFNWTTQDGNFLFGETTASPVIDTAGVYKLVVTDQTNQCQDSTTVNISIDADIPVVNAGLDTSITCTRLELSLNGNGSAVGTDIEYAWAGPGIVSGGNTLEPLINETGEYILEVTDTSNSCVVTDTVLVIFDTISPSAVITASQTLLITCDITTLPLSGSNSTPSGNVSYEWTTTDGEITNGDVSVTATIGSGGTYTLTVTDLLNGCTHQQDIFVDEDTQAPFVNVVLPDLLTCDSTSVQLEVLPPTNQPIYNFAWSGPGQILNEETATPTVFETGIYNIIVTDTSNGCAGDSSVVVIQDISLPDAEASAIGILDCDNLTAMVTGEGSTESGVIYQWVTTSSGTIATPNALTSEVNAAGDYFLIVTKLENGCKDTAETKVIASSLPIVDVLLSFDQPDCLDSEGIIFIDSIIGGTPPYSFSLDDSLFLNYPQFSYLDPGAYNLLVEDVNGCSWDADVSLLLPNEIYVELGEDIYISQGQNADLEAQVSLSLNDINSVVWTNLPDSADCPDCLAQEVFPLETTTFYVEVTDSTGCIGSDNVTVFVSEEDPFFVPSGFTPNGDNINDRLIFFAGKNIENVPSFSIYDRWGNRVFHQENFEPNNPLYGWDGNFEGRPMRPAVFAWKAVVEFLNGKRKVFYGDLTLVR